MKRKIIKQGHNTLTITVPSEWAKKSNLKPGDEINISEENDNLRISTKDLDDEFKKTEINITGFDIPQIWKYLMGAYREGYDEVMIKYDPKRKLDDPYKFLSKNRTIQKKDMESKSMFRVIHKFIDRFIGFEVIDNGKDFVKIKDMGRATDKEFDASLRRLFLLLIQMSEEILESIKNNEIELLSHINDVDINLDKFHDYCIRVLNKTKKFGNKKSQILFSTLYLLELLGDEYKNIAIHLLHDFKKPKFDKLLDVSQEMDLQIKEFYSVFYKFNDNKIKKISELDKKMYISFPQRYDHASDNEKEIFHHFRIIQRYINALLELRVEMNFTK